MMMDPTIWPLKGWCHSSECDLNFYLPFPLYISPEPLTGTIAHPWTVIPVLSSYCLDPTWDPAGTQGTSSAGDLPQTLRGAQSACTNLIQSTLVSPRGGKKRQIVSVLTWFPAWTREKSSRLPLYQLSLWKAGCEILGWKQRTSFREQKSRGSQVSPLNIAKEGLSILKEALLFF